MLNNEYKREIRVLILVSFFILNFFQKVLTKSVLGFIIDFVHRTWAGGRVVNGTRL